jgi:hypothetical protein
MICVNLDQEHCQGPGQRSQLWRMAFATALPSLKVTGSPELSWMGKGLLSECGRPETMVVSRLHARLFKGL